MDFDYNLLFTDESINTSTDMKEITNLLNRIEGNDQIKQDILNIVAKQFGLLTGRVYLYKGMAISLLEKNKKMGISEPTQATESENELSKNAIR